MLRRKLLIALGVGALAAPFASRAQQQKVYRIGFLGNSTAALEANLVGPFREGLRDLGYVEGRNIVIEYRWAEGRYGFSRTDFRACRPKVDVVAAGTPAAPLSSERRRQPARHRRRSGQHGSRRDLARPGGNRRTSLRRISKERP